MEEDEDMMSVAAVLVGMSSKRSTTIDSSIVVKVNSIQTNTTTAITFIVVTVVLLHVRKALLVVAPEHLLVPGSDTSGIVIMVMMSGEGGMELRGVLPAVEAQVHGPGARIMGGAAETVLVAVSVRIVDAAVNRDPDPDLLRCNVIVVVETPLCRTKLAETAMNIVIEMNNTIITRIIRTQTENLNGKAADDDDVLVDNDDDGANHPPAITLMRDPTLHHRLLQDLPVLLRRIIRTLLLEPVL